MSVVRVDDLVKDGAKRRRLRRSTILDKIINTNRNAAQAIKAAIPIGRKCTGCQRSGFGGKSGKSRILGGCSRGNHPAGSRLCRRATRRDAGRCGGRRWHLRRGARGVRGPFGAAVSRPGGERRGPACLLAAFWA